MNHRTESAGRRCSLRGAAPEIGVERYSGARHMADGMRRARGTCHYGTLYLVTTTAMEHRMKTQRLHLKCVYACMRVCVCVCICIYIYIYIHMHNYIYTHIFIYVCVYVCIYIYIYMYVCVCVYVYIACMHACMGWMAGWMDGWMDRCMWEQEKRGRARKAEGGLP